MTPLYPVWLSVCDPRGVWHALPGVVTVDHGPIFEFRYKVICMGYREFPSGRILPTPDGQYVTWASDALITAREAKAA